VTYFQNSVSGAGMRAFIVTNFDAAIAAALARPPLTHIVLEDQPPVHYESFGDYPGKTTWGG
jgi:hypothetical protein